jgi:hypothetical protein
MRISVWSHDANPSVDPRLMKKSLSACESAVTVGLLRWIDPKNKLNGCIGTRRFHPRELPDNEKMIAAGNMRDAWITRQSGYGGPLVLQLAT